MSPAPRGEGSGRRPRCGRRSGDPAVRGGAAGQGCRGGWRPGVRPPARAPGRGGRPAIRGGASGRRLRGGRVAGRQGGGGGWADGGKGVRIGGAKPPQMNAYAAAAVHATVAVHAGTAVNDAATRRGCHPSGMPWSRSRPPRAMHTPKAIVCNGQCEPQPPTRATSELPAVRRLRATCHLFLS